MSDKVWRWTVFVIENENESIWRDGNQNDSI